MKYKTIDPYSDTSIGKFIFIYGNTDVGKTTSILQSSPEPILYIMGESRNPKPSLDAIGRKVKFHNNPILFDNPVEFRSFLVSQLEKDSTPSPYKTLFFDGCSQFMNVSLGTLLEEEYYESRTGSKDALMVNEKNKPKRPVAEETGRDMKLYGALGREMIRIFDLLSKFSMEKDVIVIVSALSKKITRMKKREQMDGKIIDINNPNWSKLMDTLGIDDDFALNNYIVPNFDGMMFIDVFPGMVDMIGYVEERTDEENNIIYPPTVNFSSAEALTKYTGADRGKRSSVLLDISKIVGYTKSKEKEK